MAVGGGEVYAHLVASGDHLTPDVSGAGVEAEDTALHAIAETSEPCLQTGLSFADGKALDSSADFAYGDGADIEFSLMVTKPLHDAFVRFGLHQFAENVGIHKVAYNARE